MAIGNASHSDTEQHGDGTQRQVSRRRGIVPGRKQMSEYDTIVDNTVKEWTSSVGETIRKEYTDAMAAAK